MSVDPGALIVGIVMLVCGVGATYAGVALIRNLHGFADMAIRHYADYPGRGGWRRASRDDPGYSSGEGTTLAAFVDVPKTMRQVKLVGWAVVPFGLFMTLLGVIFTVAALTGNIEPA